MPRLLPFIDAIVFARVYTQRLLDAIDPSDWFVVPAGCPTHVAWQVGHLAMAEYLLTLRQTRGARPEDEAILPADYIGRFGRESIPDPIPANNPTITELRAVFDRVHEAVLRELPLIPEKDLDSAPTRPHSLCQTKWESVRWAAHHEMVHAGQIGLIRRMLGKKQLW